MENKRGLSWVKMLFILDDNDYDFHNKFNQRGRCELHSPNKVDNMAFNNIYANAIQGKFYLPGDVKKCMPGYSAYKLNSDMKKVRDLIQIMNSNMQPFVDQILNFAKGMTTAASASLLEFEKSLESIREAAREIEKKYPRDPNLSIPPVKVMRPARLNGKVIPVIYHHIRSNC